ncbi:hypothetical protein [Micromonospora sp. NPDC023644]|uniref:hypothetical protein n=1 Tax=Micromonospora sp. NPDC023644 TaxID=3154321 RepID=UPI003408BE7D
MPHQAPENVYGNQNCNSATVAHDPSSLHGGKWTWPLSLLPCGGAPGSTPRSANPAGLAIVDALTLGDAAPLDEMRDLLTVLDALNTATGTDRADLLDRLATFHTRRHSPRHCHIDHQSFGELLRQPQSPGGRPPPATAGRRLPHPTRARRR